MLIEISKAKEDKSHIFSLLCEAKKVDHIEVKSTIVVPEANKRTGKETELDNGCQNTIQQEELVLMF